MLPRMGGSGMTRGTSRSALVDDGQVAHDTTEGDRTATATTHLDNLQEGAQVGGHVYRRGEKGVVHQVDETAIPTLTETDSRRWEYARSNAQEHFAELYAMAVQTPELLHTDYVARPAETVRRLRALVAEHGRNRSPKLDSLKRELARAEKLQHQRREIFDIIRNDVFHADRRARAAVERMRGRGIEADVIRSFEERAARLSTAQQVAALEREVVR